MDWFLHKTLCKIGAGALHCTFFSPCFPYFFSSLFVTSLELVGFFQSFFNSYIIYMEKRRSHLWRIDCELYNGSRYNPPIYHVPDWCSQMPTLHVVGEDREVKPLKNIRRDILYDSMHASFNLMVQLGQAQYIQKWPTCIDSLPTQVVHSMWTKCNIYPHNTGTTMLA